MGEGDMGLRTRHLQFLWRDASRFIDQIYRGLGSDNATLPRQLGRSSSKDDGLVSCIHLRKMLVHLCEERPVETKKALLMA